MIQAMPENKMMQAPMMRLHHHPTRSRHREDQDDQTTTTSSSKEPSRSSPRKLFLGALHHLRLTLGINIMDGGRHHCTRARHQATILLRRSSLILVVKVAITRAVVIIGAIGTNAGSTGSKSTQPKRP